MSNEVSTIVPTAKSEKVEICYIIQGRCGKEWFDGCIDICDTLEQAIEVMNIRNRCHLKVEHRITKRTITTTDEVVR